MSLRLFTTVFILILAASVPLLADSAAPSFNPSGGTAVGGDPNHPDDKGELPNYDSSDDSDNGMAAPQISEEQLIENSLQVCQKLYHAEDYEGCAKATQIIIDKYPKRKLFWIHYLNALCQEHLEFYDRALSQYEEVKREAGHSTYAHAAQFRIALCLIHLHRRDEAVYTLREIIETDPLSEYRMQAFIHLGNIYREARRWKAAELIYRDLIRLYPGSTWANLSMFYLAECFAFSGETDRAIKVYQQMQVTESLPVEFKAQAQIRIGELYLKEKQWQNSIKAFRIALRDYDDVPGINVMAQQKIALAEDARRYGEVRYQPGQNPGAILQPPADEAFELKQQNEALPY